MVRRIFVLIHRWAGLAMAGFLVIVGLTGSVLAFREEIDAWLNPELLTVAKRDAPLIDPITLREKVAALYPDVSLDFIPLHIEPNRSALYVFVPGGEKPEILNRVNVYFDPYTGEKLGERVRWSGPSLERRNIVSFLYRLHFSLALPPGSERIGHYILGVVALVWTVDCFVALGLSLPSWRRANAGASNALPPRRGFSIHPVLGLWTWPMLLLFAWSSVSFNLHEAYTPVMKTLFEFSIPASRFKPRTTPLKNPALGWREAYARGKELLRSDADRRGLTIEYEEYLGLIRSLGFYSMHARSSGDPFKESQTKVYFDADTGALVRAEFPGDGAQPMGDAVSNWLAMLHMAGVFRLPYRILVFALGLVIAALSVTDVRGWWKNRSVRRAARNAAEPLRAPAIEEARK